MNGKLLAYDDSNPGDTIITTFRKPLDPVTADRTRAAARSAVMSSIPEVISIRPINANSHVFNMNTWVKSKLKYSIVFIKDENFI